MIKYTRLAGLFLVVIVLFGCGSSKIKTWQVEGTVTLDGKPLPDGMIRFHPLDDVRCRTASGAVKNGQFTLQTPGGNFGGGAIDGEYKVTFSVLTPPKVDQKRINDEDYFAPEATEFLPSTYAKRDETPFSATVVRRKNVFDFELKSTP